VVRSSASGRRTRSVFGDRLVGGGALLSDYHGGMFHPNSIWNG
jgi:hypothetical protein